MTDLLKVLICLGVLSMGVYSCDDCEEDTVDIDACINASLNLTQDFESYVEFKKNKAKWECLNYRDYSYEFVPQHQVCYNQRVYVEVLNAQIVDTIILHPGVESHCESNFNFWVTIDEIFYRIEEAVDSSIQFTEVLFLQGKTPPIADRISIQYDTITGLPIDGYIDYNFGIGDDEYSWQILNFSGIR